MNVEDYLAVSTDSIMSLRIN